MKIELSKTHINMLLNKAKISFNECINAKENEFLQQEVDIPLGTITLKETSVKIIFSQESIDKYILEAVLILYASNKEIGKYVYCENEEGNPIDDSLIFF